MLIFTLDFIIHPSWLVILSDGLDSNIHLKIGFEHMMLVDLLGSIVNIRYLTIRCLFDQ